ncbi:hypothetical protein [Bradyrhizobium macuxiense]|uniref:hypothetical protein n=1 Tax=Bradyrhizobium macuxiense TaxID=1755647 RepID=UPI00191B55EC|nr:hypothetical protein [Bradyrhizobium macuxiense]
MIGITRALEPDVPKRVRQRRVLERLESSAVHGKLLSAFNLVISGWAASMLAVRSTSSLMCVKRTL